MADGANSSNSGQGIPGHQPAGGDTPAQPVDVRMELVDSLPGDRAVIGVEQEGCFVWLADRNHVSAQARDELTEQLQQIIRERWWVQNWPGAN